MKGYLNKKSFFITLILIHIISLKINASKALPYLLKITTDIIAVEVPFNDGHYQHFSKVIIEDYTTGNIFEIEHIESLPAFVPFSGSGIVRYETWLGEVHTRNISSPGEYDPIEFWDERTFIVDWGGEENLFTYGSRLGHDDKINIEVIDFASMNFLYPETNKTNCITDPTEEKFNVISDSVPRPGSGEVRTNNEEFSLENQTEYYIYVSHQPLNPFDSLEIGRSRMPINDFANWGIIRFYYDYEEYIDRNNHIFSFNDLSTNPESNYGKPIYYTVIARFAYSSDYAYSKSVGPYYFFKPLPDLNVSVKERYSCSPYVKLDAEADSSIVAELDNYSFAIKQGSGASEYESNVIDAEANSVGLKSFEMTPEGDIGVAMFNVSNPQDYSVLYYHKNDHLDSAKLSNYQCASNTGFSYDGVISPIQLQVDLNEYSFEPDVGPKLTYNVTANGEEADVTASLISDDPIGNRYGEFEKHIYYSTIYETVPESDITHLSSSKKVVRGFKPDERHRLMHISKGGCKSSVWFEISDPPVLEVENITPGTADCHKNNTLTKVSALADLSITVKGGIGPYEIYVIRETDGFTSYYDSSSSYNIEIENLFSGPTDYTLYVLDSYSGWEEKPFKINSNPELLIDASPTGLTCYQSGDGEVSLNVDGFHADKIDNFYFNGYPQGSTVTNLDKGIYSFSVLDVYGCSDTVHNVFVDEPPPLLADATGSKIARYGDSTGTISLNVSGGVGHYEYKLIEENPTKNAIDSNQFPTGSVVIDSLKSNIYDIIVYDLNKCTATANDILVEQPKFPLDIKVVDKTDVDCYGNKTGSIVLEASGGWNQEGYLFGMNGQTMGSSPVINNLSSSATTDTFFVVDNMNVQDSITEKINEPDSLTLAFDRVYPPLCHGGSDGKVLLRLQGGTVPYLIDSVYETTDTSFVIEGLKADTNVAVWVSDSNACKAGAVTKITEPEKLETKAVSTENPNCQQNDGAISLVSKGGVGPYYYNWYYSDLNKDLNKDTNTVNQLYSGLYRVIVADENRCQDSLYITLSDKNAPKISQLNTSEVSCHGGSDGVLEGLKIVNGTPSYKVKLEYPETGKEYPFGEGEALQNLEAGLYFLSITDSMNCKLKEEVEIAQPEKLIILSDIVHPTCHGDKNGRISLRAEGGIPSYSYLWDNADTVRLLEDIPAGKYTVMVWDSNRCTEKDTFTLEGPLPPITNWDTDSAILCTGGSLELDGGDYTSFLWIYNGDTISNKRLITAKDSGRYVLHFTDSNLCPGMDTFLLKVSDSPLTIKMLVADSARVNEEIRAVDVTYPMPDSIAWSFDNEIVHLDSNYSSKVFTSWYPGEVEVTMKAFYGNCISDYKKKVIIYEDGSLPELKSSQEPIISAYNVYPNPNNGQFVLEVLLSQKANLQLNLYNNRGMIIDQKSIMDEGKVLVPYNISHLDDGVYLIDLRANNERMGIKLIISE